MYAAPLSADTIVGKIVEHIVETVATHCDITAGSALYGETTIDIDACRTSEIDGGRRHNLEGSCAVNPYATPHHNRFDGRKGGVPIHYEGIIEYGIPAPCPEIDLLLHPTLKTEGEIVLDELGNIIAIYRRSEFDEHTDAIALAHFNILCLTASGVVEIDAIHIHPKTSLIAMFEAHLTDANTIRGAIVSPETIGARGDGAEEGVERQGVATKGQEVIAARGKRVVVGARR